MRGLGWEEGRVPASGHEDGAEWVPAMLPAKVPARLGSGAGWGEVWMQGRSSQTKSEQTHCSTDSGCAEMVEQKLLLSVINLRHADYFSLSSGEHADTFRNNM